VGYANAATSILGEGWLHLVRVPDELLKGSVFLVFEDGGRTHVGGTAFFLATRDPWCLYH
jgi:hypothetical protein